MHHCKLPLPGPVAKSPARPVWQSSVSLTSAKAWVGMAEVFVSYAHADQSTVSKIAGQLEHRGHSVWWDQRLMGGQDFGPAIESAIQRANCAVVAWSGIARNSLWVRAEATLAFESGKFVQLSLDGAKPPLPFTMLHLLDMSEWRGSANEPSFVQLEQAVASVVRGGDAGQVPPTSPAPRLGGFGPTVAVGGASLALVILASGLVGLGSAGVFTASAFGVVSGGMLLAAMLAFGHMLTRVISTYLASRQ